MSMLEWAAQPGTILTIVLGVVGWGLGIWQSLTGVGLRRKLDKLEGQNREMGKYIMRALAAPDQKQREGIAVYFERFVNETDEQKRQKYLDSIAVNFEISLSAAAGGSATPGKPKDDG